MTKIDTVSDLKRLAGDKPFKVVYRKINGRFRAAVAQFGVVTNSKGKQLSAGKLDAEQAALENETGIVRYFDHKADGYRQFDLSRLLSLEIGGQKFNFRKAA